MSCDGSRWSHRRISPQQRSGSPSKRRTPERAVSPQVGVPVRSRPCPRSQSAASPECSAANRGPVNARIGGPTSHISPMPWAKLAFVPSCDSVPLSHHAGRTWVAKRRGADGAASGSPRTEGRIRPVGQVDPGRRRCRTRWETPRTTTTTPSRPARRSTAPPKAVSPIAINASARPSVTYITARIRTSFATRARADTRAVRRATPPKAMNPAPGIRRPAGVRRPYRPISYGS